MATSRNAPCPCRSGKKFKVCCLPKSKPVTRPPAPVQHRIGFHDDGLDDLNDLSNSVLGLVRERRFDEALAVCQRLLTDHPDVVDGLDRSALVHSALGDHAKAAEFYRQAIEFIKDPIRSNYYDLDCFDADLSNELRLAESGAASQRA
jgi:tetratricopeptide (TPR) repeat protein